MISNDEGIIMVKRIQENEKFLRKYLYCNHKYRKDLIQAASPEQIACLCEATLNVVNKNVPITQAKIRKLKPFKRVIKKISFEKVPIEKKKKLLVQQGGFLPLILSTVLGVLANKLLS
jgi:hypothetical protein